MANGTKIKPIACRVEKTDEIDAARREGCQYLQGFFLSSSAIAARRTIPTNHVVCLRLMAALSEESTEMKQIESMVMMDTSLTYQLLRRVNSVAYSLNTRVTSIRNALVIVGTDAFRTLVSGALADLFASTQSRVLITIALERAKFCETLAPRLNERGPKLYLLGMLSLVDIILQIPMAQVMETLPLENDMKAALRGEQSSIGMVLELVRAYQAANWEKCELLQDKLGISERESAGTYMESVHWTALMLRE
jgi:EAL and modified HD-GYP domain-containing signal transduction protein